MFNWQKGMHRLDLPPSRVLQLHRSLNSIQVALPGFPSQEANAYFCLFAAGQGLRGAVILELLDSRSLVFYLNEGEVGKEEADRLQQEGLNFGESMGFMLADLDLPTLSAKAKADLWDSLPLKTGGQQAPAAAPPVAPPDESPGTSPAKPAPARPAPATATPKAAPVQPVPTKAAPARPVTVKSAPAKPTAAKPAGADRQPAAVAASGKTMEELPVPLSMRKREPPSPAEFAARRQRLQENLGRLLASL